MLKGSRLLTHDQAPRVIGAIVTPTALSGDVDNYGPTDLDRAAQLRIDGGASNRNITGIRAGVDGQELVVANIGTTNSLVLVHESGSSTAANRILGANGANVTIRPTGMCRLIYDGTSSRWRTMAV
jgi:hypothetical protein